MEKKTKTGILEYIAKADTKGCKFKEEPETWYNPATEEAKSMIEESMIGKQVEIVLLEGQEHKFTNIVLLEQKEMNYDEIVKLKSEKTNCKSIVEEQMKKEQNLKGTYTERKDRRIIKQNAGSHASNYIKVLQDKGHYKDNNNPEDIQKDFFEFADKFVDWVYKE